MRGATEGWELRPFDMLDYTLSSLAGLVLTQGGGLGKLATRCDRVLHHDCAAELFSGKLLNQNSMNEMLDFIHDVQLFPTIRPFSYGLGVMAIEHEKFGPVWFNVGYSLGYQSWWVYLPAMKVACTVLINQDPERMNDTIWHPVEYLIDMLVLS